MVTALHLVSFRCSRCTVGLVDEELGALIGCHYTEKVGFLTGGSLGGSRGSLSRELTLVRVLGLLMGFAHFPELGLYHFIVGADL